MIRDQAAMVQVLLDRGLPPERILCIHGQLDRSLMLAFVQAASRRVAAWTVDSVFVHVSGHGFFRGDTTATARAGLLFEDSADVGDEGYLFWADFLSTLAMPDGVELTLLPDL